MTATIMEEMAFEIAEEAYKENFESRRELTLQVFETQEVGREVLQLRQRLLPPRLDPSHLGRLFEKLPAFRRGAS